MENKINIYIRVCGQEGEVALYDNQTEEITSVGAIAPKEPFYFLVNEDGQRKRLFFVDQIGAPIAADESLCIAQLCVENAAQYADFDYYNIYQPNLGKLASFYIPADSPFDPQKLHPVMANWIFPDGRVATMLVGVEYEGNQKIWGLRPDPEADEIECGNRIFGPFQDMPYRSLSVNFDHQNPIWGMNPRKDEFDLDDMFPFDNEPLEASVPDDVPADDAPAAAEGVDPTADIVDLNTKMYTSADFHSSYRSSRYSKSDEGLTGVEIGSVCGYVDEADRFVIVPQFDRAGNFKEGAAYVQVNNKYGYIDPQGDFIVKPRFDRADDFKEGTARVEIGGLKGFIDKKGSFLNYRLFDAVRDFAEGAARVKVNSLYGFIDKAGEFILKPEYDDLHDFHEGLAAVKLNGKWGYYDLEGNCVVAPTTYDEALDFSDGLAAVRVGRKWGYLDRQGRLAIKPAFGEVTDFVDGVARVRVGQLWGLIDRAGNWIAEPRFTSFRDFHQGLALVKLNRKWGYADRTGACVIDAHYDRARAFAPDGTAEVKSNGRWHRIDTTGTPVS